MNSKEEKVYDLLVIGATGFTGAYVLKELVRIRAGGDDDKLMLGEIGTTFTLAIAGRNKTKLEGLVEKISREVEEFEGKIDILVADCSDYDQILEVTSKARVVLSCVGPYQKYGEPIVKACINSSTHYVDITGEAPFINSCFFNYNQQAKDNDVMIVHSCGFDSIPFDMSQTMIRKRMVEKGVTPHSIEAYVTYHYDNFGQMINYSTYHSAILALTAKNTYQQKIKEILPKIEYTGQFLAPNFIPSYDSQLEGYKILFPSPDISLAKLGYQISAKFPQDHPLYYGKSSTPLPPAQILMYFTLPSIFMVIGMIIGFPILGLLTRFQWGIWFLLNYPQIATLGIIWPLNKGGPSQKHIDSAGFQMRFKAKGISGTLLTGSSVSTANLKPDVSVEATFKGPEPGYTFTSKAMVLSALTILKEKVKDAKPLSNGVITPSLAFYNTKYFDRLMVLDPRISFEFTDEQ